MDKLAVLADLHQGNALLHPAGGGAVVDGGRGSGGWWEGQWWTVGGVVVDCGRGGGA